MGTVKYWSRRRHATLDTITTVTIIASTCKTASRICARGVGMAIVGIECAFIIITAGCAIARITNIASTRKTAVRIRAHGVGMAIVGIKLAFINVA